MWNLTKILSHHEYFHTFTQGIIYNFQNLSCDRDSGRYPKKKDRVAKLHYITRHVQNSCRHILATMFSRHERCGCNQHFYMKRSRPQDSDAVYGLSKFNFNLNLWDFEICYFRLRMLSSSFFCCCCCFFFFFFSIQRFL